MKLIYVWLENYNDRIVNQEFLFSPEFIIHYDNDWNELHISRNKEYIKGFYGENVLDVAAIVGENGAGKTTVARCLYDICGGITPIDDEGDGNKCAKIVIYLKEGCSGQKEKLLICYFLKGISEKKVHSDVDCKLVNLYRMTKEDFEDAMEEHEMSTVFFTNAFDASHITPNYGIGEYSEMGVKKSMCFSPMLMIKREMHHIRESYGAKSKESGLELTVIQQYASKMGIDIGEAYGSAVNYNFLITAGNVPDKVKEMLPVFSDFGLSLVPFGEYILRNRKFGMMSQFDKSVYFIRKNIYENILSNLPGNNWEMLYANIVCEIALFLNLFNGDNINVDFDEMEKNYQDIKSMGAFRTIMSQIADSDKKELVIKIRGISDLDIKILHDFFGIVDRKEPILKDTQWYQQIKAFRLMYESRYGNLEIPNRVNGKHTELIDILMKEYRNPESFWGRMFKVMPNPMSSGEVALINIFSSIYKVMLDETEGSILLIADEIDAFLHPKWQQDILMCMTEWINREEKFKKKKVQIILASHSPIILSDIPDDRVIYLKKLCGVVSKDNPTFGANISRLFYDSFFMDDGSIGAFSKRKIQAAADYIGNKECSVGRREAKYIIENIGEPFVKKKLQKDWEYKKFAGGHND